MSKKKCTDGRRNNKPPKSGQFKPGQSGNPAGRPKDSDKPLRLSMDGLRQFIMNAAFQPVSINEGGRTREVPKLHVIITQLYTKAAKGDVRAAELAFKLMKSAASENDDILAENLLGWFNLRDAVVRSKTNLGSLEHYSTMHRYFTYKKDMRKFEGKECWPYEHDEPETEADWVLFFKFFNQLKAGTLDKAPWPLEFPSEEKPQRSVEEIIEYIKNRSKDEDAEDKE